MKTGMIMNDWNDIGEAFAQELNTISYKKSEFKFYPTFLKLVLICLMVL